MKMTLTRYSGVLISQRDAVVSGRIRLPVNTASRTYELSQKTHVRCDFIRLGSVTTNRKNGLAGEQLVVGTDSRSVSTGPSRIFSVLKEGCHVDYSREFVGTVYCTYGQSNTTIMSHLLKFSLKDSWMCLLYCYKCWLRDGFVIRKLIQYTAWTY